MLSVGYGQGHHSAAAALAEEFSVRGWQTRTVDPCAMSSPRFFGLTQRFYNFCVRRMPWLWGVAYSCTDTADWRGAMCLPVMKGCMRVISGLLAEYDPDCVVCTYPLYAYMLDDMASRGEGVPPYVVVVTDAREISRPWMLSGAPLVCVPDELSAEKVIGEFGLDSATVACTGFPVRHAFACASAHTPPTADNLRIVYGAYCSTRRVCRDIKALATAYPLADITVLAGQRSRGISRLLRLESVCARVRVLPCTDRMDTLFAHAHVYVGKAGAATVFEAYAARVPLLVNFALPGQEQGNLELLLEDGAGEWVDSTGDLVLAVRRLLRDGAALWSSKVRAMETAGRSGGAPCIVDKVEGLLV